MGFEFNLIIFVFIAIISFGITYFVRSISLKLKIIDVPNERSSHEVPTPRGGGLAIVVSWFMAISIMFFWGLIDNYLFYAFISGILLAITSYFDDLFNLPPIVRLFAQVITAILALFFLKGIDPIVVLGMGFGFWFILYPIGIIGIVWFINLYNFLDGIDGYASIEAIIVSLMIYFFTKDVVLLALIASTIGFLYWNWPKAKIFMGDVGSTQLGFILVVLGIYFHNESKLSIIHWVIITSPFWFDATITLYRRWRNKEKLSQAHRKHTYQRFVQSGFSHLGTDMVLVIMNIVVFILVYFSHKYDYLLLPSFLINIFFLYSIVRIVDRRVPFK